MKRISFFFALVFCLIGRSQVTADTLRLVQSHGGAFSGIAAQNGYVYATQGGSFVTYDATSSGTLIEIARRPIAMENARIRIFGSRAIAASDRIVVLDLSNPGDPVPVQTINQTGSDQVIYDHYLYSVNAAALSVYDLSTPGDSPVLVRTQAVQYPAPSLQILGNHLVGIGYQLSTSSLADPSSPTAFSVVLAANGGSGLGNSAVLGSSLYLASQSMIRVFRETSGEIGLFATWDYQSAPLIVFSNGSANFHRIAGAQADGKDRLYLGDAESVFAIEPDGGTDAPPFLEVHGGTGFISQLTADGNSCYALPQTLMTILKISAGALSPRSLLQEGYVFYGDGNPTPPRFLNVSGDVLLEANTNVIEAFHINADDTVTSVSTQIVVPNSNDLQGLVYHRVGNFVVVFTQHGYRVYDYSNPASPMKVDENYDTLTTFYHAAAYQNYLYVARRFDAEILAVGNDGHLSSVKSIPIVATNFQIGAGKLYATTRTTSLLEAYSLADPANPTLVGSAPVSPPSLSGPQFEIDGNHVLANNLLFDFSDPAHPASTAYYPPSNSILDLDGDVVWSHYTMSSEARTLDNYQTPFATLKLPVSNASPHGIKMTHLPNGHLFFARDGNFQIVAYDPSQRGEVKDVAATEIYTAAYGFASSAIATEIGSKIRFIDIGANGDAWNLRSEVTSLDPLSAAGDSSGNLLADGGFIYDAADLANPVPAGEYLGGPILYFDKHKLFAGVPSSLYYYYVSDSGSSSLLSQSALYPQQNPANAISGVFPTDSGIYVSSIIHPSGEAFFVSPLYKYSENTDHSFTQVGGIENTGFGIGQRSGPRFYSGLRNIYHENMDGSFAQLPSTTDFEGVQVLRVEGLYAYCQDAGTSLKKLDVSDLNNPTTAALLPGVLPAKIATKRAGERFLVGVTATGAAFVIDETTEIDPPAVTEAVLLQSTATRATADRNHDGILDATDLVGP